MPDQSLTLLQAALMEAVRPTPAGRVDRVRALLEQAAPGVPDEATIRWALGRHANDHTGAIGDCADAVCQDVMPALDPLAAHGCLHAAVVIDGDKRVWYPCRSHEGDVHHYAAHWPACPGPWCRLPYEHHVAGTMHDIPGGRVEYHDAIGVKDAV